jgi:hypothetical protein
MRQLGFDVCPCHHSGIPPNSSSIYSPCNNLYREHARTPAHARTAPRHSLHPTSTFRSRSAVGSTFHDTRTRRIIIRFSPKFSGLNAAHLLSASHGTLPSLLTVPEHRLNRSSASLRRRRSQSSASTCHARSVGFTQPQLSVGLSPAVSFTVAQRANQRYPRTRHARTTAHARTRLVPPRNKPVLLHHRLYARHQAGSAQPPLTGTRKSRPLPGHAPSTTVPKHVRTL